MEGQQRENKQSSEIDLSQFLNWLGAGVRRFGNSIVSGMASLRSLFMNNRLFFAGIIILGLVLGTLYSELLKKKFYKSTLVLSCDYLNNQTLENTIQKLNMLASEPDGEGLAELLKIDVGMAKNIQSFTFSPFVSEDDVVEMEVLREQLNNVAADKKEIVENVISKLKIENKNAYEISVMVYDPAIVKTLEQSLVNYFKSSEYIKRRMEINKISLDSRKQKLLSESLKLDSLKDLLFASYRDIAKASRGSGNVILGDEKLADPLEVYTVDMEINEEILSIEKQLYLQKDFELVDGFTTFKQPESASLPKILFISFWVSFAMGYLIIGSWKLDKMLAEYHKETA